MLCKCLAQQGTFKTTYPTPAILYLGILWGTILLFLVSKFSASQNCFMTLNCLTNYISWKDLNMTKSCY